MVAPVSGIYAKVRQKFHLSRLCRFPEPPLFNDFALKAHDVLIG